MKIRTFTAETMAEVLADIRKAMGGDAIIISTTNTAEGIVVTAAIEIEETTPTSTYQSSSTEYMGRIDRICEFHRTTKMIPALWKDAIAGFIGRSNSPFEAALSAFITIDDIWLEKLTSSDPIILAGPPGSGKSVVLAKITACLLSMGKEPKVITTDDKKSGAIAQMNAYMKAMGITPQLVKHPESLRTTYLALNPGQVMVVDTPATSPHNRQDLAFLKHYAQAVDGNLTLVMPGNMDAEEAADMARTYKEVRAKNLIVTHLDMCKRFGCLLSACYAGELTLVSITKNPRIGDGVHAVTPSMITELLNKSLPGNKEAAS